MTVADQPTPKPDVLPLLEHLRGCPHNDVGATDPSDTPLIAVPGERLALTCRGVVRLVSIHSNFPGRGTRTVARGVPLAELPAHLRQIAEARA